MDHSNIVYLPVGKLLHHPKNPRKDLGDLSELMESIDKVGIMQNLTVVPCTDEDYGEGYYWVVIGNRRLEAAELAGLDELPCVIADLDEKEQVEVMLIENMQRNDLTIYEEAQGIQMLLDLGDTIETIAEKTGFSKTTVRRRAKLMELDQDLLKQASDGEQQLTMSDIDDLNKIEDVKKRNAVLKTFGTNNFQYSLKSALNDQENIKKRKKLLSELSAFATKLDKDPGYSNSSYERLGSFHATSDPEKLKTYAADKDTKYYYYADNYNWIYMFKEKDPAEVEKANDEASARKEREDKIRGAQQKIDVELKRMTELRRDFVQSMSNSTAKSHLKKIVTGYIACLLSAEDYYADEIEALYIYLVGDTDASLEDDFGEPDEKARNEVFEHFSKFTSTCPEKIILFMLYEFVEQGTGFRTHYRGNTVYEEDKELTALYKFLTSIGYQMSDEEKAIVDGTSDLYDHSDDKE